MKRRLKKIRVQHISLVPRGANQLPVVFKEDNNTVEISTLIKNNLEEKGELLSVVYAPEMRDSQGDIASAQVIKEMAYEATRDGLNLDVRHDGKTLGKDKAFVAESFIVQKNDSRFDGMKDYSGNPVDVTGGWAIVVKVEDEGLKALYREGKWNGVSLAGPAEVEAEKEDDTVVASFLSRLTKALFPHTNPPAGDLDMDRKELDALLEKRDEALLEKIGKLVKPEPVAPTDADLAKAEADKAEALKAEADKSKPLFKGDSTKPEDVQAHFDALTKWNLQKDVDWSDPVSVKKYHEEISKLAEDDGVEKEEEVSAAAKASQAGNSKAALKKEEKFIAWGKAMANGEVLKD